MVEKTRFYETLYLLRNDISDEELSTIQEKLNGAVSSNNGEILKSEKWDERDLAYPIKNYTKGIYYIMTYKALPSVAAEMEKHLRFYNTDILRFLTVVIDEDHATEKKQTEKTEEGGTV